MKKLMTFLATLSVLGLLTGCNFPGHSDSEKSQVSTTKVKTKQHHKKKKSSSKKKEAIQKQTEQQASSQSSTQSQSAANSSPAADNSAANQQEPANNNGTTTNKTNNDSPKAPAQGQQDSASQPKNNVPANWRVNFEQDLKATYHVTPKEYVNVGNGKWGVWVNEVDTGTVPYVTVDENTGSYYRQ
ncbi:hypothetical protein HU830_04465 [Lactobacillus sp. DCY120]|uniref:Lipoprotein n=1 Tax=Bombilactobacillus apium TaxID=2675299 RepID=A0A850R7B7_9LACO|nr:hypothetical protein [Bombilactobacillus apium]NVY96425.1 hypothetical protein [Bombilactobacillus apium]